MSSPELPSFLMPLTTFEITRDPMLLDADRATPDQKLVSNVAMSGQEQTNWCWSAVTQSVKVWSGTKVSQTDVATAHIGFNGRRQTCQLPHGSESNGASCGAGNGCAAMCNDPHVLSVVLKENKLFSRYISEQDAPSFDDIAHALNADKPVPCRVQWAAGGGHFVLVVGWTVDESGVQLVHVLDPASVAAGESVPERVLGFDQFVGEYSSSGVTGTINYCYEVYRVADR